MNVRRMISDARPFCALSVVCVSNTHSHSISCARVFVYFVIGATPANVDVRSVHACERVGLGGDCFICNTTQELCVVRVFGPQALNAG